MDIGEGMAGGADEAYRMLMQTGPDTPAGQYLRLFWQPVYRAEDLAVGKAVPIEIMSGRYTLYRGESGTPYLVGAQCAHRGTQLSTGWVEGETIRCRYHGWVYDGSGQCVGQPGDDDSFAANVRIGRYPVADYLGLTWAYFGPSPPPALRRFPDFEKPGLRLVGPREIWPCNYYDRVDNDSAHPPFAHRESFRRAGRRGPAPARIMAEETEYGIRTHVAGRDGQQGFTHRYVPNFAHISHGGNSQDKTGGTRVLGANKSSAVPNERLLMYVPINDDRMVTFALDHLALEGEAAVAYEARQREAMAKVDVNELNRTAEAVLAGDLRIEDLDPSRTIYETFWIEDYVTVVGQGRIANRSKEHLGRIDTGVVLLRKVILREIAKMMEGRPLKQWKVPAEGVGHLRPAMVASR